MAPVPQSQSQQQLVAGVSFQRRRPRILQTTLLIALSLTSTAAVTATPQSRSFQPKQNQTANALQPWVLQLDDATIRTGVRDWVTSNTDKTQVVAKYGHIADWDTSRVQDFSKLFLHARFFDEDLSRWNLSSATDLSYTFAFASSFRGSSDRRVQSGSPAVWDDDANAQLSSTTNANPDAYTLANWDISRVTSLAFTFHHASVFEGDGMVNWDVGRVTDMTYFAQGATNFNPNLWRWDTRNVKSFNRAFHNASRFQQSLCWTLHSHAVAVQTFCGTDGAGFDDACDVSSTSSTGTHDTTTHQQAVLGSAINAKYHNCCECDYSEEQHGNNGYYNLNDDDAFWADDNGNNNNTHDGTIGIVLASCIWGLVLLMLCTVAYVTLRRHDEVRNWLRTTLQYSLNKNNRDDGDSDGSDGGNTDDHATPGHVAGATAVATFVGTRNDTSLTIILDTDAPESHNQEYNDSNDTIIPMMIGADHVQYEGAATNSATSESALVAAVLTSLTIPSSQEQQQQPWWIPATATTVDSPHAAVVSHNPHDSTGGPQQEPDIVC